MKSAHATVPGHRLTARSHRVKNANFAQLTVLVLALICANVTSFTQETRVLLLNVPK